MPPTLQQLSDELLLTPPTIQRGLSRLIDAGLVSIDRRVLLGQAEEFLVHGLRYVFPAKLAGEARGVATSWGGRPS